MTSRPTPPQPPIPRQGYVLAAVIFVQALCAAIFLHDIIKDYQELNGKVFGDFHQMVEMIGAFALSIGVVVQSQVLAQLMRRHARAERGLSIASGALHDLMESYFRNWGLTAAEADVAAFTMKGFAIPEIAELRGTREGTVKTQLNAIYRKAGVTGRGPLISLLLEDLMSQSLIGDNNG